MYLVPDLCVIRGPRPSDQILSTPPLVWIEILSRADKVIPVNQRMRKLLESEIPIIWVIDADWMEAEVHTQGGSYGVKDGILRVDGTPIEVPLNGLEEE